MGRYREEEYLQLSGIQHMAFCERQWALICIEQAWAENARTLEGKYLHERVDEPFADETRRDIRTVRAMPLLSKRLGLRGIADVVEFARNPVFVKGLTVSMKGRRGWWHPYPIEYKRGKPKPDERDAVQLCAQAYALEEMMGIRINRGYLYYAQTRRREEVIFDQKLRNKVELLAARMHTMFTEGRTPPAKKGKHCALCSLKEICQPGLSQIKRTAKEYIKWMMAKGVDDD